MRKFEKIRENVLLCQKFFKGSSFYLFWGPNTLLGTKDCVDFLKFRPSHDFENELHKFLRIEM